jgi:hypothetical protein
MHVTILCIFSLLGLMAGAQGSYPPSIKLSIVQPQKQYSDTIPQGKNKPGLNAYVEAPGNSIPNAIRNQQQPAFVFKGNNGGGFDIYQSTIDGMTVLRPDKNNPSNIPTIGYPIHPNKTVLISPKFLTDSTAKAKKP